MDLTTVQEDALVELINIGFGRAAAALSKLTGHRVQLEVPQITMCPIDEMTDQLRPMLQNEVASVHQFFSGPVDGDALLVLDQHSASILKELLTNEPALPLELDRSAREVVTEIGNILLNACLGTFGNLLKVKVSFSVPHLSLESLEGVVGSLGRCRYRCDLASNDVGCRGEPRWDAHNRSSERGVERFDPIIQRANNRARRGRSRRPQPAPRDAPSGTPFPRLRAASGGAITRR